MKKNMLVIPAILALFALICQIPQDPDKNPSNAAATFLTINDQTPTGVISINANENVSIGYELHLPGFIDSVAIEILSSSSPQNVEFRQVIKGPWSEVNPVTTIVFRAAGTKTCILTTYKTNGTQSEESLVFEVVVKAGNRPPVWSPDTVDLVSEKGIAITQNLKLYADDPDKNMLLFTITPPSGAQFTVSDSFLTSGTALAVGNYAVSVIVSDGDLADTGTVVWKVYVPSEAHAELEDDTAETVTGRSVTIDVLANDRIPSGGTLVISSVTQGSNGIAAVRGDRVIYSPDAGFTGRDAIKYIVNGKDTGRVSIVVNEVSSSNLSPYWSPDVIQLFSVYSTATANNLKVNAYDPDADPLTCTVISQDNTEFSLTGFSLKSVALTGVGTYTITVELSDGALTDTATVIWKVIAAATIHAAVTNDIAETPANTPVTIDVLKNDSIAGGQQLILTSVSQGEHGKAIVQDQKVDYIPQSGFSGNDSCFYVVNGMDTGRVSITVAQEAVVNKAPVWAPATVEFSSEKGKSATLKLGDYATDADADPLTFTAELPQGTVFTIAGDAISTDGSPDTGLYSISVSVSDGKATDTGTIKWRIYPPATAHATITDDTTETGVGEAVTIDVLANDTIASGALLLTGAIDGNHGNAITRNGKVVYTPDEGYAGKDTIRYVVNGIDTGHVFIIVNEPEVTIVNDTLNVPEGGNGTVNVLLNDAASSGKLTVASVVNGKKGTAAISGDSAIVYTASGANTGADTVEYIVNTGDTGYVVVTITATQFFIKDDSASVLQGQERIIRVLANDSISSGKLVINKATDGTLGSVTITDTTIIYTANDNADGKDSLMYYVNSNRDSAMVRITVLPIEITTVNDAITVDEDGGPVTIDVLANDAITTGTMAVTSVSGANLGTATVADNIVTFTPSPDSNGVDTLEYLVNDAKAEIIIITITPVDDKPAFTVKDTASTISEGQKDTLVLKAKDADKTPVTLSQVGKPSWVTVTTAADSIRIIVAPGYDVATATTNPKIATFTIQGVSGGDTIKQTITITVNNVNTAPAFTSPAATIAVDEGATKTTVFAATDAEGDAVTITTASTPALPAWITVTGTGASVSLVTAPGYGIATAAAPTTTQNVTLLASDGTNSVQCTVAVTVSNVNTSPAFTNPTPAIAVNEGASKTTAFTATDADGDAVTITTATTPALPAWITVTGTGASVSLVTAPGYGVATTAAPSTTHNVVLVASDGTNSVQYTVAVTVSNVNQAPAFTTFPAATVNVQMGGSLTTVALAGSDLDGDAVTYSLVTSIAGMTLSSADRIIRWDIPRIGYSVGQSVTVTARVSDGFANTDRSFSVVIDAHQWTLMSSTIAGKTTSSTYFAAVGSDTVFMGDKDVGNTEAINILRSTNGGQSFAASPFLSYAVGDVDPQIGYLNAKGNSVYAAGQNRHSSYFLVYPWNSNVYSETEMKLLRTIDVSPNGKRLIASQDTYWPASDPPPPVVTYIDETITRMADTLFDTLVSISCGNTYIWAIDANTSAYYSSAYTVPGSYHGFISHSFSYNFNKVYCDNNNGDTAYALVNGSNSFYQLVQPTSRSPRTLSSGVIPSGMIILTGSLGWFWTTAGKVYFSNNEFKTISEEVLKDGGNTVQIINMFKSSDGTTVFANTKAADGTIKLFRY